MRAPAGSVSSQRMYQGLWNVATSQGVRLLLKAIRSLSSHVYCSLPGCQSAYDPIITT